MPPTMTLPEFETRLYGQAIEIREPAKDAVGTVGTLVGYAAVFNQRSVDLGGFREFIRPGAFAESLGKDDQRALLGHNALYVLGRRSAGTLDLREDSKGLEYLIKLPDTGMGRDAKVSVQRGDMNQMSFGFRTLEDDWTEETGTRLLVRELIKASLREVSLVAFPAYPQTSAGVRSEDAESIVKEGRRRVASAGGTEAPSRRARLIKAYQRTRELWT